jgi:NADPH-dependent 2,4-dienoyl-CoA reductase/sulfur reductase-like enzyme
VGGQARVTASAGGAGPSAVRRCDIAVVGAGPAGLAAAAAAALAGCAVILVDPAERTGGNYWRAGPAGVGARLDAGVYTGLQSVVSERVEHLAGATVWHVGDGFALHTTAGPVVADRVVLATGAYDRSLPFPGWQLPGVVTPGAAQALLKGSGVLVGQRVVVAGAGPFLLPVAAGLVRAGAEVVGVYEAGRPRRYLRAGRGLPTVAVRAGAAARYAAVLARHRVPYRTGRMVRAAYGDPTVSAVDVGRVGADGRIGTDPVERVACDAVAVGYGFTANLDLALALGCDTAIGADGGLVVVTDPDQATSVAGVYAAGEVTGVGGARLAVVEGLLAGSAAVVSLGAGPALSARQEASLRRRRARLRLFAAAMHRVHAVPAGWTAALPDEAIVCRCEEVTAGRIRAAVTDLDAPDARTVRSLVRPGMGWCQGRVCGAATAALVADVHGRAVTATDLRPFARRLLATPLLLGDLAGSGPGGPVPDGPVPGGPVFPVRRHAP